jgi:hypothetical protein
VKVSFFFGTRATISHRPATQPNQNDDFHHIIQLFAPPLSRLDFWPAINRASPILPCPSYHFFSSSSLNYYYNYSLFDVCAMFPRHCTHTSLERLVPKLQQQLLLISIWLSRTTSYRHQEKKENKIRRKSFLSCFIYLFCQRCSRLVFSSRVAHTYIQGKWMGVE